jgi:hypothetical protein
MVYEAIMGIFQQVMMEKKKKCMDNSKKGIAKSKHGKKSKIRLMMIFVTLL